MAFHWTCPFCHHKSILQPDDIHREVHQWDTRKYGKVNLHSSYRQCPNKDCNEVEVIAALENSKISHDHKSLGRRQWPLRPSSKAKPWPAYIPQPLIADYDEACEIELLSPKASATLSRRCLQGMIRDFWRIKKARLVDEVDALEEKVDAQTWDAIDGLRKIGNIGAHMEKDINVIVDVDPDEARLLRELVETLFEDWYVARYLRDQRMQKIKAAAEAKTKPAAKPAEPA